MDNIEKKHFKKIKITENKTIYIIIEEKMIILKDNIISASMNPIGYIFHIEDEYYYLDHDNNFKKEIIYEFTDECLR